MGDAHDAVEKALEKHGRANKKTEEALESLASLFAPIKLTPKYFDQLVNEARASLENIRTQERQIIYQLIKILRCQVDWCKQRSQRFEGFFCFLVGSAVFFQRFFYGIVSVPDLTETTGDFSHINAAVFAVVVVIAVVVIIAVVVAVVIITVVCGSIRTRLWTRFRIDIGRVGKAGEDVTHTVRIFFCFCECVQYDVNGAWIVSEC